ncbi:MAG TPA: histidine kinase [Pseudonocardiaceae bacterium]
MVGKRSSRGGGEVIDADELGPLFTFLSPSSAPNGPRSARDWVIDAVTFVVAIGTGMLAALYSGNADNGLLPLPAEWLNLVVGALACGSMWWRRSWPVWIAVVLNVVSIPFSAASGASIIALFTVAVHRRFTIALQVAVFSVLTALAQYLIYPSSQPTPGNFGLDVAFAALFVIVAVGWGVVVRTRRQLIRSFAERALRAEAEQELRVDQGRRRERERIAREMHDALGHRLSLLSVHAGALEYRNDMPQDELARAAGIIRASARQCLVDLREIIVVLRSVELPDGEQRPAPSLVDLAELVEESRQAGMAVTVTGELTDPATVPVAVGRHGYRIVQEGLTNARKHAPGEAVSLAVAGGPGTGLTLEIRNGLPSGPPERPAVPGSGMGLAGLAERAVLAGGQLEYGRTLTSEFRLWVRLPWPA